MPKRTRTRTSGPKLVARKGRKKAAARRASKFKPTKVFKKFVKQIVHDNIDTKSNAWFVVGGNNTVKNTNGPIDSGDLHSVWDNGGIATGTSVLDRVGKEVILTKGELHIWLRAANDTYSANTGDFYVDLYVFTPVRYKKQSTFDAAARTLVAAQFLNNPQKTAQPYDGNANAATFRTNSDQVTLHKHIRMRVHNEVAGRSTWFRHLVIPIRTGKLNFDANNTPDNHNVCFALGYYNVNNTLNPDLSTRLTYFAFTKFWWRD